MIRMLNLTFGSVIFVWALVTPSLGVRAAEIANPTGKFLGRFLEQTAVANDQNFSICVTLRNVSDKDVFLTDGFRGQLMTSFRDPEGNADSRWSPTMPTLAPAVVVPSKERYYFTLEESSSLQTCRTYEYAGFHYDVLIVQTRFQSWLKRTMQLPPFVEEASTFLGRPLYEDEPLYSNTCVIERRHRRAMCN